MAKYPLIYGNTNSQFDITTSAGVSLSTSDTIFDVYTYTNADVDDNTQRSTAVFIIRNDAVPGAGTGLDTSKVELLNPDDLGVYEGDSISINPMVSSVPFIGTQADFNATTGNVVSTPGSDLLGTDAVDNSTAIGWLRINSDNGTIENEDLGVSSSYRIVPLYAAADIIADDIPDNSYAAVLVAFHPTENFSINEIEARFRVKTDAGAKIYPLQVNSYNEVLMAVRTYKDPASNGTWNSEDFTHVAYSPDNYVIDIGSVGTTKTREQLLECFPVNSLEILDVSPQGNVNGLYVWANSGSSNSDSITKDGVTMNRPATSIGGWSGHWENLTTYYTPDHVVAMTAGDTITEAYQTPGRNVLRQDLYVSEALVTGSHAINTVKLGYANNNLTSRITYLHANYITTGYNNTNQFNSDFPDDGNGFNNQWISYGIKYEVYNRVTFNPFDGSLTTLKNKITENVASNSAHPQLGATTGMLSERGSDYEFSLETRWTNNTGGTESLTGESRNKEVIDSFAFSANTDKLMLEGESFCSDVTPVSYVNSSDETVTDGTFDIFSGATNTTTLNYRFNFKLEGSDIYTIPSSSGNVSLTPTNEPVFGQYTASLKLKEDDYVWNFEESASYPGCDRAEALNQRFQALFYAKNSYLKLIQLSGTIYPAESGLSSNADTGSTWTPSTWYDNSGSVVANTSVAWDTNNLYSGNGGAVWSKSAAYGASFADVIQRNVLAKLYNQSRRHVVDKTGGLIKEFKPLDSILQLNTPTYHSADNDYVSYCEFKLISEGDDAIYIHTISFDDDGTDQLLDFDNTIAANNLYGTQIYGYKPGYNASDAAATSNDPEMTFRVAGVMGNDEFTTGRTFLNIGGAGGVASLDAGNMMKTYRDYNSGAFFAVPRPLLYLGGNATIEQCNADDAGQTVANIESLNTSSYNHNSGLDYTFEQDGDAANAPYGNPTITVKMKVPAKGTLIDFGNYYTTMKIAYYKNERTNRYASSSENTNEYAQSDIRLHEMKVIVKMTVVPSPILSVTDNENQEYFNQDTVYMGNINIG